MTLDSLFLNIHAFISYTLKRGHMYVDTYDYFVKQLVGQCGFGSQHRHFGTSICETYLS